LNGTFYNSFSESDRARIQSTTVVNSDNPWYANDGWYEFTGETDDTYYPSGGNDTTDKIFLLSLDEVARYFGDSGKLAAGDPLWPDDRTRSFSDQYDPNRVAYYGSSAAWWWLRSPGGDSIHAADVFSNGHVLVDNHLVGNSSGGVRPALWLNL